MYCSHKAVLARFRLAASKMDLPLIVLARCCWTRRYFLAPFLVRYFSFPSCCLCLVQRRHQPHLLCDDDCKLWQHERLPLQQLSDRLLSLPLLLLLLALHAAAAALHCAPAADLLHTNDCAALTRAPCGVAMSAGLVDRVAQRGGQTWLTAWLLHSNPTQRAVFTR